MTDPQGLQSDEVSRLEDEVGNPKEIWDGLRDRVQVESVRQFRQVENDWLRLMWCLDQYRQRGVPPRGMGNPKVSDVKRLEAVYRSKGNWFAELMALLLQNRTSQRIRPRAKVSGFSQNHQIDLAWPDRGEDPLVCVETKVTGAPSFRGTNSRSALSDFANRRKELKFAATDLKLWRRQQETEINHWSVWRREARPMTFFLWAARLSTDRPAGNDRIDKLVAEARALVDTYLEGAGLVAWHDKGDHYEIVPVPDQEQVSRLDDVLYRIESEIKAAAPMGRVPPPERPPSRVVNTTGLAPDANTD
jgi:hypothetical protein